MLFLSDKIFSTIDAIIIQPYLKNKLELNQYNKIKINLKESIQKNLIDKYCEEIFFNSFDNYLEGNEIINKFIKQCYSVDRGNFISSKSWTKLICKDFVRKYPQYKKYENKIENIVNELYNIIFDNLNNIEGSNDIRIFTNIFYDLISKDKEEIKSEEKKEISLIEESSQYVIEQAKELEKVFVKTSFFENLIHSLKNNKTIVLVGDSGIGKSATSFMLANSFKYNYIINFIEGTYNGGKEDINNLIKSIKNNVTQNEIIVFDDFLGKTKLNDSEEYLLLIEELIKIMKYCPCKKLILNTRKTILEEAKKSRVSLEAFLTFDVKIVDCNNLYNVKERVKILWNYILNNDVKYIVKPLLEDEKTLGLIIDNVNFSPLIIDRATKACKIEKTKDFGKIILDLLNNPKFLWENEINALDNSSLDYLFILYSLSEKFISKEIVDNCYNEFIRKNAIKQREDLEDTVKGLTALIIYDNKGNITFRHPSLIDYLSKIVYKRKECLLSGSVYFEQIERLDNQNEKITELVYNPEEFFKLDVFPFFFGDKPIEFSNNICVKYIKYIFKLNVRNKEYEDIIIMCVKRIFSFGRLMMLFAADTIIDIISMRYYNLNSILKNKENLKLLYDCPSSEKVWELIETTIIKDELKCDFCKIDKDLQNEILDKIGQLLTEQSERIIRERFDDYLEDNIDDYSESENYEDIAQEIVDMIPEDLDLDEIEKSIINIAEEHKLYNLDLSEVRYDLFDYESCIDNFAIDKVYERLSN